MVCFIILIVFDNHLDIHLFLIFSHQFFIVQNNHLDARTLDALEQGGWPEEAVKGYAEVGGTPHLDHRHTVFGQLLEGAETLEKIAAVETGAQDKPAEEVVIVGIDVE